MKSRLVVLILVALFYNTFGFEQGHYKSYANKRYQEHLLKLFHVGGPIACASKCLQTDGCLSFNVGPEEQGNRRCELMSTVEWDSGRLGHNEGWRYFVEWCETKFRNSCYWIAGRGSFATGRARCAAHGGHIVDITDAAENQFIVESFKALTQGAMWLAASDLDEEEVFRWYTTNKLLGESYSNWYPGIPPQEHGGKDCVLLSYYRQWSSYWFVKRCGLIKEICCEYP